MTSLETALRRINADLTQAGVPFAVVGGLAVSVRTEPLFKTGRRARPRTATCSPRACMPGRERPSRRTSSDVRTARGYAGRVDRDEILRVLRAFEESGLEYVLIGATAMGFHGVVRATEDIDLLIRATADNVERLRSALRSAYANDPLIEDISPDDLLGEYPAVRYYPPSGDLYFDVLTRLGEAASFETVEAETKTVEGIHVQVATPAALYRLKKGTVRPQDHQDAAAMRDRFNLTNEED